MAARAEMLPLGIGQVSEWTCRSSDDSMGWASDNNWSVSTCQKIGGNSPWYENEVRQAGK